VLEIPENVRKSTRFGMDFLICLKINSMSPEERKTKTETALQNLGIPTNSWLPLTEDEHDVRLRTPIEIAKRCVILARLVCLACDECSREEILEYFEDYSLMDSVSEEEKNLLGKDSLEKNEKIELSWKAEAIWLLLWAIKKIEELKLPTETCDVLMLVDKLPKQCDDPTTFFRTSSLRMSNEILDMSDMLYRLHWASRDAYLNEKDAPANLHEGVIMERHCAINWITYYADNWDDITTDT
jgi:hypothetical protein